MRAMVCNNFNEPLSLQEVPTPTPGPSEVLINVAAAGVNFVDQLIVTGKYQLKPSLPFIPGFEVAGRVAAVGDQVDRIKVGQQVFATPGLTGGGYAQATVADQSNVFPLPASLSVGQGATFVQSYCTALFSLVNRVQLEAGQSLLVLGASGGVGRAAVDIGKALGAKVIAAASSADRLANCEALGADGYINYSEEDLKARARELSGGGVDVVYDPLGGDYSEQGLRALGDNGALLIIGFAAGNIPRLPTNQILLRNRRVIGVEWGGWRTLNPGMQSELMEELLTLVDTGKLQPHEPQRYPLAELPQALADVTSRKVVGKVALSV
jgi:NADPH:quinone reductase